MNRPAIEHVGIFGSSMTGKSTLARRFSRTSQRNQIIYDPTAHGQDWTDGWKPDDSHFFGGDKFAKVYERPDEFIRKATRGADADIFADEAADVFALSMTANHPLITKGRHNGLRVFVISQRPQMVAPTVRNQTSLIYVFRLSRSDLDTVVKDAGFNVGDIDFKLPLAAGEMMTIDKITGKIHNGFYYPA